MIVALYARVSTAKQAEMDLSIPDQVRQVKEWCVREGHSVAVEYIEPGASATDDRRPVFQQMISEACADPPPFEARGGAFPLPVLPGFAASSPSTSAS